MLNDIMAVFYYILFWFILVLKVVIKQKLKVFRSLHLKARKVTNEIYM